jgi:hypothetical protein
MAEFWNVLTRPATSNGLGVSTEVACAEVEKIEDVMELRRTATRPTAN